MINLSTKQQLSRPNGVKLFTVPWSAEGTVFAKALERRSSARLGELTGF